MISRDIKIRNSNIEIRNKPEYQMTKIPKDKIFYICLIKTTSIEVKQQNSKITSQYP